MTLNLIKKFIVVIFFILQCQSQQMSVKSEKVIRKPSQEEIEKAKDDAINKQKIENLKTMAEGKKQEDIFNIAEDYDDFIFAFFNNIENTEFNSIIYEGDEFEFNSIKNTLSEIRRYKYYYLTGKSIDISEYDFSKKGFYIKVYESAVAPPSEWFSNFAYKYNRIESNKIFLPISEDEAREFKNNKKEFQVIFVLKPFIEKDKVFQCKIVGSQSVTYMTVGKKEIDYFNEQNAKWFPECKELSISVKRISANIINLVITDLVTEKKYFHKKDK